MSARVNPQELLQKLRYYIENKPELVLEAIQEVKPAAKTEEERLVLHYLEVAARKRIEQKLTH